MDPLLWELYESGSPDDEVSVLIRLDTGVEPPRSIRIVSRFGDIFTGRMQRSEIVAVRNLPGVLSLKSADPVTPPGIFDPESESESESVDEIESVDEAMLEFEGLGRVPETGKGVVVGVCDWGLDFTHNNFRNADGSTRLLCIWDQRGSGSPLAPEPYGQGRLLTREMINSALADPDPCGVLGYDASAADPTNAGSHGTHVTDIVAGNRREPGSQVGLASEADLVFVHLAPTKVGELGSLGDSIGLLEGLDFIRRQAAGRPCVLHLSAGKTLGPKRGSTLLERAVDTMLLEPGIALVQSVGNYANASMHTHARIGPDQHHEIVWITPAHDRTPNQVELWYSGEDVFDVTVVAPDGRQFTVPLGDRDTVGDGRTIWGNFYHRLREPNSGLNHVVIYLYTTAPNGRWRIRLRGRDIVDGRVHAWIERDVSGRYQSRFERSQATAGFTTNTICNCFRAIAVGAYDATQRSRPATVFSSRGPTADGRQKPEIAAPGFRILAARSTPKAGWRGERRLCVKSGTSMAAPWVSGTVALMYAAAGRPLTIHEVRRILIGTADADPHRGARRLTSTQLGYGYLNIPKAVEAARRLGRAGRDRTAPAQSAAPVTTTAGRESEWPTEAEEALPLEDEATWAIAEDQSEATHLDENTGWAPTWVEDAAGGEATDDLSGVSAESGNEPEADDDTEPEASAAEMEAHGCSCGCGHCANATPAEIESGELQSDSDEGDVEELFQEIEDESAPYEWEDIREALESVDAER